MYKVYATDTDNSPLKVGETRYIEDAVGIAEYAFEQLANAGFQKVQVFAPDKFNPVARVSARGIEDFNPAY